MSPRVHSGVAVQPPRRGCGRTVAGSGAGSFAILRRVDALGDAEPVPQLAPGRAERAGELAAASDQLRRLNSRPDVAARLALQRAAAGAPIPPLFLASREEALHCV